MSSEDVSFSLTEAHEPTTVPETSVADDAAFPFPNKPRLSNDGGEQHGEIKPSENLCFSDSIDETIGVHPNTQQTFYGNIPSQDNDSREIFSGPKVNNNLSVTEVTHNEISCKSLPTADLKNAPSSVSNLQGSSDEESESPLLTPVSSLLNNIMSSTNKHATKGLDLQVLNSKLNPNQQLQPTKEPKLNNPSASFSPERKSLDSKNIDRPLKQTRRKISCNVIDELTDNIHPTESDITLKVKKSAVDLTNSPELFVTSEDSDDPEAETLFDDDITEMAATELMDSSDVTVTKETKVSR